MRTLSNTMHPQYPAKQREQLDEAYDAWDTANNVAEHRNYEDDARNQAADNAWTFYTNLKAEFDTPKRRVVFAQHADGNEYEPHLFGQ